MISSSDFDIKLLFKDVIRYEYDTYIQQRIMKDKTSFVGDDSHCSSVVVEKNLKMTVELSQIDKQN